MSRLWPAAIAASLVVLVAPMTARASDVSPSPLPGTSPTPTVVEPVRVLLDEISPKAPRSKDKLHLAGRIIAGDRPVDDLVIRVRFGPVLSRFDLHLQQQKPKPPPGLAGTPVSGPSHLDPGATERLSLDVPMRLVPYLSTDGVHPLEVEIQGRLDSAADTTVLGRADTFLPVFSGQPPTPTRIAWAVTVAAPPQANPASAITDPGITGMVAPNGRLSRILTAAVQVKDSVKGAASTPITFVVDTDLLRALKRAATGSFKVPGSNKTYPRSDNAAQFLSVLGKNATPEQLVAMATADADIVSLAEADLGGEAIGALQDARAAAGEILGVRPRGDIAVPPGGHLTPATIDLLHAHSITTALLAEEAFPPQPDLTYTPTAYAHLTSATGALRVAVADSALNALVAQGERSAPTPRMAEQLFLAETAMITSQRPAVAQSVLVTTPRDWEPGTRFGRAVLADSASVPWLTGSSIDDVTTGLDDTEHRTAPVLTASTTLPKDLLVTITKTRADVKDFSSVFADPEKQNITPPLEHALYAAESAQWRADLSSAIVRSQASTAALERLRDSIRAAAPRVVTLTNATSPIPVTVINELDIEVVVLLRIQSTNRTRLRSDYSQPVTLPAHSKKRVDVPVHVESSGTFPVTVAAETPSGHLLAPSVRFIVRSAAYGAIALWITGGALAVLLLAIALRAVRRLRRRPVSP